MSKPLIIVESPAKTKTLKNFLGGRYDIKASMGHVRDLPRSRLGVDVANDFQPKYAVIPDRKHVLADLKKAAEKASQVYLASDPDREGEAIAWHIAEALKIPDARRIEFNSITKQAVTDALEHPRQIDSKRVDAQQARRVLDRLVGYKISPLLCDRVRRNLSAGRVQSVAVRLICDRERQIQNFVPVESWSITAKLTPQDQDFPFEARLVKIDKNKADLKNESDAKGVLAELEGAAYRVAKTARTQRKRNAPKPFITSTMQQEAARKLGFSSSRTMRLAQDLYEGIELGSEGSVGLITYLRTDSTRVAPEALDEARDYIGKTFGSEYLPAQAKQYAKGKTAQDAHEAIRPTSVFREPDKISQYLNADQLKLYRLIWQRFLASQMNPALYDVDTVDIEAGRFGFRATGAVEKFKGFRILYTEGVDDREKEPDDEDRPPLPELSVGELLRLLGLVPEQHFTEPPPRYSEASLVRALEENGIGRPSTYASIIQTIVDRQYVELQQKRFHPTDLGFTVTDLLVKHFPTVLEVAFTADVESKLDGVARGDLDWVKLLHDFYGPFNEALEAASANMERIKAQPVETDKLCPKCGSKMLLREGRFGPFLGCSSYPECKTIVNIDDADKQEGEQPDLGTCPNCGKPLTKRRGRFGEFLGCSGYPDCKTIVNPDRETGVTCPACSQGQVVQKRSKRSKVFYGCNRYPDCDFVLWDKPTGEKCPQCSSLLVSKTLKSRGAIIACSSRDCTYSRDAEPGAAGEAA